MRTHLFFLARNWTAIMLKKLTIAMAIVLRIQTVMGSAIL